MKSKSRTVTAFKEGVTYSVDDINNLPGNLVNIYFRKPKSDEEDPYCWGALDRSDNEICVKSFKLVIEVYE